MRNHETDALQSEIEDLWQRRDDGTAHSAEAAAAVDAAIGLLDTGRARVAEIAAGEVVVHEWLKMAIPLLYKQAQPVPSRCGPFECADKIPLKSQLDGRGLQVSPGAVIRRGSYQAPGVVVMPSHIGIGSHVGEGTLVDSWVGVGSCAQIGRNVHLFAGCGLGGMIEPHGRARGHRGRCLHRRPVDDLQRRQGRGGRAIGAGSLLTDTIPVIDAATGQELSRGMIPPWTVAVPAHRSRDFTGGTFGLPCMLVIKHLKKGERHDKAKLNDAVRAQPPARPTL